jgi:hypothetical protein
VVTVKLPPRLFHQEIVTAASAASSKERILVFTDASINKNNKDKPHSLASGL